MLRLLKILITGRAKISNLHNSNGVIANGNKVSVLRERLEWIDVECLVYPEDLSENWELIEVHTSEKTMYLISSKRCGMESRNIY